LFFAAPTHEFFGGASFPPFWARNNYPTDKVPLPATEMPAAWKKDDTLIEASDASHSWR